MKLKKIISGGAVVLAFLAIFGSALFGTGNDTRLDPKTLALDGCTVIMVGKDASFDGSVMTTHSCDSGTGDWTWRYIPAADHEPGSMRKIYWIDQFLAWPPDKGLKWDLYTKDFSGLEIPQVPHTYGYMHGVFGYMNDMQVAFGESTIGTREKMENPTPAAKCDITMLTLIAMERAGTAREAIRIMGELAEKYGYGHTDTGEMLAVSDPQEVWIFEIMPVGPLWTPKSGKPGAIWCAQRIPDDHVSVCPNESRIGEIDLDNPDFFMASPNVVSYAVDNGLYDPKSGKPFNWKRAYCPAEYSAMSTNGSRGRLWRFFDRVVPSRAISPETPNMELPFSVKPDSKLTASDVMTLMRDKFEGSPWDPAKKIQGGPFANPNRLPYGFEYKGVKYDTARITSVNRAEYVTVTQSRSWLPNPVGGIVWLAWGSQDTSCFMPFYIGINKIPRSFEIGDHWVFDRKSARWAFDYADFHAQPFYSLAIQDIRKAQDQWERTAMERTPEIDRKAAELHAEDPAAARNYLTEYCLTNADNVINAWWELGDMLLVKFNHLWHYDIENRERLPITFPDWWLELLIKEHKLKSKEELKKKK